MKKVGIALSAGSAYGFSHIGVLKVLEKNNIKINYIAGTSIGALIGALYASGISAIELEDIAKETKIPDLLDFTVPNSGFLYGKKIEDLIERLTYKKEFKELAIPLSIIATDLTQGEKIVFTEGNVAKAVRASISIPALFIPVKQNRHILIDGAVVDPIPIDTIKEMGANITIATDLSVVTKYKKGKAIFPTDSNFIIETKDQFIHAMFSNFNEFIESKKKIRFLIRLLYKIVKPDKIENYIRRLLSKNYSTPEILRIILKTENIMVNELIKEKLKNIKPDILIKPDIKNITSYQYDKIDYFIKEGEKATELVMPKLKSLLR